MTRVSRAAPELSLCASVGCLFLALCLVVSPAVAASEANAAATEARSTVEAENASSGAVGTGEKVDQGGDGAALEMEMPLSESTAPGLRGFWVRFVGHFDAGRMPEALLELEQLRESRIDAGFRNLPSVSMTLVIMSRELLERSPPDVALARQLLDAARSLSPDVPELHGELARVLYETNSGSMTEVFHGYFKQFLAALDYLPSSYGVILGGVSALWLAGLLLMLFFTLAIIIRYVKLFGHDLFHLLHLRLTELQATAFAILLLAVPLVLGWGVVPMVVGCWVVLWLYLGRTERILAVLLLVFVAAWPMLQRATVNIARGVDGPEAPVFRCFYEECSAEDMKKLEAESSASLPSNEAAYVLALVKYRSAWTDPELMPALYYRLTTMIRASEEPDPRVKLLSGNVALQLGANLCTLAKGDVSAGQKYFDEARTLYGEVLVSAPKLWEAHYNMGKLLSVLNSPTEAQQYLKKASERNSAGVVAKAQASKATGAGCLESFSYNRELAVPRPDLQLLANRTWAGRMDRLPIMHEVLLGTLPPAMCYGLGLAGAFLWILQLLLAGLVRPSSRCERCHGVRCVRCREELALLTICDECLYYRMKGNYLDPKEIWYRDQAIEVKKRLIQRLEILSGVIVPGLGQFLQGRAIRGLMFLGGIALILGLVFLAPSVAEVASAPRIPGEHNVLGVMFGAILAAALYLWSLLDLMS